jgi:short subunit dehydrogenase-like uncharacterized protein
MSAVQKEFDIVVFGATSFVGRLLVIYLNERYGADGDLKWALAGRSPAKLDALKSELDLTALPTLVAEAGDKAALRDMAARTRVVCTTVGPYALYGSALVAACVAEGTDYCDLTGEVQWIARMIDAHEEAARQSGARIIHTCGFDSIPSDLGVWFTQQQAQAQLGEHCSEIRMGIRRARGSFSGGTIESLTNAIDEARRDGAVRKRMQNPYGLCPANQRRGVRQKNVTSPAYLDEAGSWVGPFIMASINTRIVHRSHALAGRPWGDDFRYDESMMLGDGLAGRLRAGALAAGTGGLVGLLALAPSRALLKRFALPKAGEGPSEEAQRKGHFDFRFFGHTASGRRIVTRVTGDRDPGYGSTCKMLGEAAVCLAREELAHAEGGFPTPSHAFGSHLVDRLTARAGLTFDVLETQ